jgi:hypothetical protein
MPFDGISTIYTARSATEPHSVGPDRPFYAPTSISARPIPAGYVSRRADSIAAASAVLRRARDLIANEQNWCKGSFARSWYNVPVLPQSTFARRFCAIGAIMRAGRQLRLRTRDACLALQWQTVQPVEVWNDAPARTHAEVVAAFDAAVVAIEAAA